MKIPFLFAPHDNNLDAPLSKWVVAFAEWDYITYDAKWMRWPEVGDYPLVPDLDFVEDENIYIFDNEKDALSKMKELWTIAEI